MQEDTMKYSIIVDRGADQWGHKNYRPLFTEHFKGPQPKYQKRERPKLIKRLLRTVKRTKAEIASVTSVYDTEGQWVKIISLRSGGHARTEGVKMSNMRTDKPSPISESVVYQPDHTTERKEGGAGHGRFS
jgi:hypothetical protein